MKTFVSVTKSLVLIFALGIAANAQSPEKQTLQISRLLKPVSDAQWQSIAGDRIREVYQVVGGDTLWDISQRLFGDPFYWPKVWALNNGRITNPHFIVPGKKVTFFPGGGSALPAFAVGDEEEEDEEEDGDEEDEEEGEDEEEDEDKPEQSSGDRGSSAPEVMGANIPRVAGVSQEWRFLPRQRWEQVNVILPPNLDPQGFDRNNKVIFKKSTGFELKALVSSEELPVLGVISFGERDITGLSAGQRVYVEPEGDGEMEIGKTYTVTMDPIDLPSGGGSGLSYHNLGTVQIIGLKDDLFIAEITNSSAEIRRGALIVPRFKRYREPNPRPGPDDIEGNLVLDPVLEVTENTSQFRQVFIDRGAEDGVQPGMVFRAYIYDDPKTEEEITDADLVGEADFLVVQVTEDFCAALVLRSANPIRNGREVVLLTDVSDLLEEYGVDFSSDAEVDATVQEEDLDEDDEDFDEEDDGDDLDSLGPTEGLTPEEEKELKQLEDWRGNKEDAQKQDDEDVETFDDEFEEEEDEEGDDEEEEDLDEEDLDDLDDEEDEGEDEDLDEEDLEDFDEEEEDEEEEDEEEEDEEEDEDEGDDDDDTFELEEPDDIDTSEAEDELDDEEGDSFFDDDEG